jgi:thiamine biosynthesis protein ThiI
MNLVSLVSSGIDSPVATYLMAKQTKNMILVHANNQPFTDEQEQKNFLKLVHHLHDLCPQINKVIIVPHGSALTQYKDKAHQRFTCVFCKRMLVRYADQIAHQYNSHGIVMGDSLGQVASQTLYNLKVVESAINLPILRPLIGMDKEDVIRIAKEIGTYELSIKPSQSCTAVPKKPSTHATMEQLHNEEQHLDIKKLIENAIQKATIVSL